VDPSTGRPRGEGGGRGHPPTAPSLAEDDPTGWKAIDRLIGSVSSGISDISEKHDDYLYGDPRD